MDLKDLEEIDMYPSLDIKRMIMDFEIQKKLNEVIEVLDREKEQKSAGS